MWMTVVWIAVDMPLVAAYGFISNVIACIPVLFIAAVPAD
jgi:hypothetical protein